MNNKFYRNTHELAPVPHWQGPSRECKLSGVQTVERGRGGGWEYRACCLVPLWVWKPRVARYLNFWASNWTFLLIFFGGTGIWIQGFVLPNQVFYCLSHTSNPFCSGYSWNEVSQTICPGCPGTTFLLISASQVAKIIGIDHQLSPNFLSAGYYSR
jgi:hypothetical protein